MNEQTLNKRMQHLFPHVEGKKTTKLPVDPQDEKLL